MKSALVLSALLFSCSLSVPAAEPERHQQIHNDVTCLAFSAVDGGYIFTAHDEMFHGRKKFAHQIIMVDVGKSPLHQFTVSEGNTARERKHVRKHDMGLFKNNCTEMIPQFSESMMSAYKRYTLH